MGCGGILLAALLLAGGFALGKGVQEGRITEARGMLEKAGVDLSDAAAVAAYVDANYDALLENEHWAVIHGVSAMVASMLGDYAGQFAAKATGDETGLIEMIVAPMVEQGIKGAGAQK